MKNLEAGANPIGLRKGMKKATDKAVEAIAAMSSKVSGKHQMARVAAISAGDDKVGDMVADAMEKVANDGVITVSYTHLDLPVAAALLAALGVFPAEYARNILIVGEVGLNGQIYPVDGVLQTVLLARELKCSCLLYTSRRISGRDGGRIYGDRRVLKRYLFL